MPITDKGRWTNSNIDEYGRVITGSITEFGSFVFGIVISNPDSNSTALTFVVNSTTSSPTNPPNINIVSIDHSKISNHSGVNQSSVVFNFDTDVTNWTVNLFGTSPSAGTVVASGGAVSKGTNISANVLWSDMYQEGYNKVNIYGLNGIGWTPYQTDPNEPKLYSLYFNGTSDYASAPAISPYYNGSLGAIEVRFANTWSGNTTSAPLIDISNGSNKSIGLYIVEQRTDAYASLSGSLKAETNENSSNYDWWGDASIPKINDGNIHTARLETDGSNPIKIYLDGNLMSNYWHQGTSSQFVVDSTCVVRLGVSLDTHWQKYSGNIYYAKIEDVAGNVVAEWNIDNGKSTIPDTSINANSLTLSGGAWTPID